ncbi:FAD-binding protein [Natranaerofaba carboxydovora]|uniref:FAD-binding protein n=1 Tax=Natranaerofaba carboxydovora TaxID=2742683 RepID=UPI002402B38F|nr:FAD-binding protein [Natranaerofaba carboxydovora]UMZ75475.1 Fumarate reductase flavoprotein subunit [Natranaerofaba carboxydovora]
MISNYIKQIEEPAVVIGSGLAGIIAAIKLSKMNKEAAVITKKGPGKATCTSFSMGIFTSAGGSEFDEKDHYKMSFEAGEGVNQQDILKQMVEESPEAFEFLSKELGIVLNNTERGFQVKKGERPIPGSNLMDELTAIAKKLGVRFYSFHLPVELIKDGDKCQGVLALDDNNDLVYFKSKTVLLATGGFAGSFMKNDNPPAMRGEGLVLAYRAGARLKDLEFIQFYPIGFRDKRLPGFIAPIFYPKSTKLVNDEGEDLLKKHLGEGWNANTACLSERDKLGRKLEEEWQAGSQVWMDMTSCPKEEWEGLNSLPLYERISFNFEEKPFLIGPAAHFTMGGIALDEKLETGVKGLYAAGEVVGGIHGANRLGGNALTEALTFGIKCALKMEKRLTDGEELKDVELSNIEYQNPLIKILNISNNLTKSNKEGLLANEENSNENVKIIDRKLKELHWEALSPIREEATMKEGYKEGEKIRDKILNLCKLAGEGKVRKKDLKDLVTCEMSSKLFQLTVRSALQRQESRGSHYRKDYPNKDDDNFTKSFYHPQ